MIPVYIIAVVILLAFSAYFSGSEIAYNSVNRSRLEAVAEKGSKAEKALYVCEHYARALITILLGNNLVNIYASALVTLIALEIAGADASLQTQEKYSNIAAIVMTVVVLIFGESIPKIVCKANCLSFSQFAAPFMKILMKVLGPVSAWIEKLALFFTDRLPEEERDEETESEAAEMELVSIIEDSEDKGIIDEDRSELLQAALDFPDITAQEIMTSIKDVYAIDLDDDPDEIRKQIRNSSYSRLPVYRKRIDSIQGVLHLNRYYKAMLTVRDVDISSILIKPCYVYKTMKLPTIFQLLKERRTHMAFVTDEYGAVIGIVTMENVLEELFGDIDQKKDENTDEIVEKNDMTYEIDGDVTTPELCDLMEWDEEEFDFDSVTAGGWAIETLDRYPVSGDSFEYKDCTVTVLEMDGLRVSKLRIERKAVEESS